MTIVTDRNNIIANKYSTAKKEYLLNVVDYLTVKQGPRLSALFAQTPLT